MIIISIRSAVAVIRLGSRKMPSISDEMLEEYKQKNLTEQINYPIIKSSKEREIKR